MRCRPSDVLINFCKHIHAASELGHLFTRVCRRFLPYAYVFCVAVRAAVLWTCCISPSRSTLVYVFQYIHVYESFVAQGIDIRRPKWRSHSRKIKTIKHVPPFRLLSADGKRELCRIDSLNVVIRLAFSVWVAFVLRLMFWYLT